MSSVNSQASNFVYISEGSSVAFRREELSGI